MENLDLSKLSTPQLKEIKRVLLAGVPAISETESPEFAQEKSYLCHKSPPKGYPTEKSQYGDPACYRYPLNTKARCLAAWRYVHHANNRSILGSKFKSVESKIKSYAKSHYNLDLQVGESEEFDYEKAFLEYYDAETMGERCEEIVLEDEVEASTREEEKMDEKEIKALEEKVETLEDEKGTWATEKTALEEKASQVDTLTQELKDQKDELESLRAFKKEQEEAAERAEKLKNIKEKLDEAEIAANLEDEAEANYWLDMSEEVFTKTVEKIVESKKGTAASASIRVPQVNSDEEDTEDPVETVRKGLKEMKDNK